MEIKQWLISLGWRYMGQTCGCGGSPKLDQYIKDGKRLNINLRKETYKIHEFNHWSDNQTIQEIYTDSRIQ